jgi:hypothetical protein
VRAVVGYRIVLVYERKPCRRRCIERVRLEKEIYRLTQIVGEKSSALEAGCESHADKADLQRALELRAQIQERLRELVESLPHKA